MHAHEVHACEIHVYEVHTREVHACEIHAYEMQATPMRCTPMRCRPVRCNVEAEYHFCYLTDSGVYVHESCCPGVQRHLPTYMKRIKCQDGPETYMRQRWYLISVT